MLLVVLVLWLIGAVSTPWSWPIKFTGNVILELITTAITIAAVVALVRYRHD